MKICPTGRSSIFNAHHAFPLRPRCCNPRADTQARELPRVLCIECAHRCGASVFHNDGSIPLASVSSHLHWRITGRDCHGISICRLSSARFQMVTTPFQVARTWVLAGHLGSGCRHVLPHRSGQCHARRHQAAGTIQQCESSFSNGVPQHAALVLSGCRCCGHRRAWNSSSVASWLKPKNSSSSRGGFPFSPNAEVGRERTQRTQRKAH